MLTTIAYYNINVTSYVKRLSHKYVMADCVLGTVVLHLDEAARKHVAR